MNQQLYLLFEGTPRLGDLSGGSNTLASLDRPSVSDDDVYLIEIS
jgi:hypothetical protein